MAAQLPALHSDMASMDGMSTGMDNSTTAAMMSTAFTTQLGSANLWFEAWTPTSVGATVGACIGLFFLAILSRFLSAVKVCAEAAWATSMLSRRRAGLQRSGPIALGESGADPATSPSLPTDEDKAVSLVQGSSPPYVSAATVAPSRTSRGGSTSPPTLYSPPFILAIELPRALLFGLQAFIAYLIMLAVMTFNVWFFIAILLGLMVGELGCGRYIAAFGGAAAAHGGHEQGWLH